MQTEFIPYGLLILLLCSLVCLLFFLKKQKMLRWIGLGICAVGIVLSLVGLFSQRNNQLFLNGFEPCSIRQLTNANKILDASLQPQLADLGYSGISGDTLDSRVQLAAFELHFQNGSFANLQWTAITSEGGSAFEKTVQVNYEGQVFSAPKTPAFTQQVIDNTISLGSLKYFLSVLGDSDLIRTLSDIAPNSVTITFLGHLTALPTQTDIESTYLLQNEAVRPLCQVAPQDWNGCDMFSVVSEAFYASILCP